jgi:hypothetical protein
MVAVGAVDGTISFWRLHSLAELVAWTRTHRLVRELSCEEREAHNMSPLCDEHGNPPAEPAAAGRPEPVTSLTIGPAPTSEPPPVLTDLPLEPGASRFDAVQEGRTRTWRFDGRRGETVTIVVTPGGIDLEPNVELHGPGRTVVGAGDDRLSRRVRLGPIVLAATGTYQVVISGRGRTAGGYTITRPAQAG